ncbi:MAG: hypothetical protein CSB24_03020 [Deltaproteobacteria bacterium]|nr:MAG: hypothetical protein CSB24_03020 [Deltaproteobacteria bacterium]
MRIWDISPGYLNRQSLLGEHRELHGIVSIITNQKKGYSRHPETLRWLEYGWALTMRHNLLAAEMKLRNYNEQSPVKLPGNQGIWPPVYIDKPMGQLKILTEKYKSKDKGRIPLPQTPQELWSQHKYSVMARDIPMYKKIGRKVSQMPPNDDFSELCQILTEKLRTPPSPGGLKNALQHMWGHVANYYQGSKEQIHHWAMQELFDNTQKIAIKIEETYLLKSTALSELTIWL